MMQAEKIKFTAKRAAMFFGLLALCGMLRADPTPTPAAFAWIEPVNAVAGAPAVFTYRVNSRGTGPITSVRIDLPAGSGAAGAVTSSAGAAITSGASYIQLDYSQPWGLLSDPNFDIINFTLSGSAGIKYFGSYLNGIADAAGLTPDGYSQLVEFKTMTVTQTVTQTITQTFTETFSLTPTPTITLTLSSTPSVTRTVTPTVTQTITRTYEKTETNSPTVTQTVTRTVTPTITSTISISQLRVCFSASASQVTTGQAGAMLAALNIVNSGGSNETVSAVTLTVKDQYNAAVNESLIFSSMDVVDATGATLCHRPSFGTAGKIYLQLSPQVQAALQSEKELYVYADIKSTTFAANFALSIAQAQDVATAAPVFACSGNLPASAQATSLKLRTQGLNMAFYDLMPSTVSTGQKDVYGFSLSFDNPLGTDYSAALIRGITITVKDSLQNFLGADTAAATITIRDSDTVYYSSALVPAGHYVYCLFPVPARVTAGSQKNLYISADITGNTVSHAADFALGIDDPSHIFSQEANVFTSVSVTASGLMPALSSAAIIKNRAVSITVAPQDAMPAYVSTGQQSVTLMKIRLENTGGADTASAMVTRLAFNIRDISGNPVDANLLLSVIKITDESGASVYGQAAGAADTKVTVNLSAPVVVGAGSSVTLCVKADIADTYNSGVFKALLASADDVFAVDANMFARLSVENAAAFPFETGYVRIEEKLPSASLSGFSALSPHGVLKGEHDVRLMAFGVSNGSALPYSASALYTGMTLTVKDGSGVETGASLIFEKLYAVDSSGVTLCTAVPQASSKVYLEFSPHALLNPAAGPKNIFIYADILASTAIPDFEVSLQSSADVLVFDENTLNPASKTLSQAMPWNAGVSNIFTAPATDMLAWHLGNVVPTLVGMGQPGVRFIALYLYNPGFIGTADVQVHGVSLTATDALGSTLNPSALFSSVSLISPLGATVYGTAQSAAMGTTGAIYVTLSAAPLYVEAQNTKTVYVAADISVTAPGATFKLSIPAGGLDESTSVPSGAIAVSADNDAFPMDSNLTTITALAYDFKLGHTAIMPVSAYPGQSGIGAMKLDFENLNIVPVAVTSVAVTFMSADNSAIPAQSAAKTVFVRDGAGTLLGSAVAGAGSKVNVPVTGFTITKNQAESVYVSFDAADSAQGAFYIEVAAEYDICTVPLATVNPEVGEYFGNMKSGVVSMQPRSLQDSFHAYPAPYNPQNGDMTIEYYLENGSEVTIKLFTLDGRLVKTVAEKAARLQGLNNVDKWDSKNDSNKGVKSGVYLLTIEVKDSVTGATVTLTNKIAVLK